ncbi:hypothetical protein HMPREF9141_2303 [Prevotella multiformis DSM 16608]|uniref:Uncharacterized protein n=1 Tax=Prevotella multiformis DSM 16608 TaxID=888743 RepID=F0F9N6_9BACT|nr:hypothetical protein HMPREF9141_2303 [Prevotella multiformis DSM 16608]
MPHKRPKSIKGISHDLSMQESGTRRTKKLKSNGMKIIRIFPLKKKNFLCPMG